MDLQSLITLDKQEVLSKLKSSLDGLTHIEAQKRQALYGFNEIAQSPYRLLIMEAISHSTNPLVAILLIAAVVSAFTGNVVSSIIIIIMVMMSIGLDYFQSHRSLIAIRKLQRHIASTANVLRDQQWNEIPCRELVPGDIIRLIAGDLIPADALLLKAKDLHIQQAALTGESLPVEKEATYENNTPQNIEDAQNAVFSGSSVVSGTATAIVVATGQDTQFGNIIKAFAKVAPHTEFEKGITRFGLFIMKVVFFLVLFVFAVNIYLKRSLLESLLFAVALAVGLTPELLPMITTVTLAAGAVHMARKKVIVKNLSAIQNFGSIDILCSDKTGTLTCGEMILEQHLDPFGTKSENVMLWAYLNSLFGTEIPNPFNLAVLKKVNINPLDAAILKHDHPDLQPYHKIDEIPFDFERRRSSVVVDKGGMHILIIKGAPEYVIRDCTHCNIGGEIHLIDELLCKTIETTFLSLSKQGYRTLAVAYREIEPKFSYDVRDEKEMVLAGFLAFFDPALKDTPEVIKKLSREGVTIKILTGDNDLVTHHVCQQVGIDSSQILIGEQLEHISDMALGEIAEKVNVFARISPMQKQRIISVLRGRGHVVGYIGDGINDVPSLHSADVGISVAGAVDVAREAADIILLKRHLSVLLTGILEGRKSFGNVMKYLMMGTSSNFGNMLSMAGAILLLPFLPMLPTQILLNNLLYDISQIVIPTDNVDPSFARKPKHWDITIIRKFMFYIGPISSIFDFITFYVMLKIFVATEPLFQTGWFVESLATQTLVVFVIRTAKSPWKSKPSTPLIIMVLFVVSFAALLPFTPVAKFLGFVPLPPTYFLFLITATVTYLFLVEFIKKKLMWKWIAAK
ncbi:magnesium-translocating P-type ATPase [Legionella longbeachae]|uniref:Magnesium-transporting ATPase, P-type 1 n=1 Tax=Legionella longbeachae serogroup 1 (strain NSW150) TaxID=661367 RepID=D3HPF1_LEGLN|nr:magnesium-translocating P-type ATPase [Legionella longbeachae]VEE01291.1 magnesium transporter [Legionella oakridgensis]ARB92344.1 magnesium-translocating P-type ATPase [Legionella longbeachae]ARM34475.1 magnesium-translocating P-type ATPase [Legionella longbeachae]QIN31236.1 magnesium-translocating P-type ATPase [Legionella longbeachae]QIN34590.1 magnesium-translocating P-type ATPase [Legionella longbeachae]